VYAASGILYAVQGDEAAKPSSFEEHLRDARSRYADCIFRSPVEVFGQDGRALLAWWSEQLAEIDTLLQRYRGGERSEDSLELSTEPRRVLHYSFIGGEHWVEGWDGTVEDAQALLMGSVDTYASRIKSALD
jgi:hypothetical protein